MKSISCRLPAITITILSFSFQCYSQVIAGDVKRRIVMVNNDGAGIIVGADKGLLFVITAGHLVGKAPGDSPIPITLWAGKERGALCKILQSDCEKGDGACVGTGTDRGSLDIALLECAVSKDQFEAGTRREVVSWSDRFRASKRVSFIANMKDQWFTPPSWGAVSESGGHQSAPVSGGTASKDSDPSLRWRVPRKLRNECRLQDLLETISVPNTFGLALKGASGGALLSDQSEILGVIYRTNEEVNELEVHPWFNARCLIQESLRHHIQLEQIAPSALSPAEGQTQITFAMQSLRVPGFTVIPATPWFRVSRPISGFSRLQVAFDFTTGERTRTLDSAFESLRITLPAVTAQYQLAPHFGWLRRSQVLGGIYVGGGTGWMLMDSRDSLSGNFQQRNSRAWTGIFEAGVNFRLPNRSWGINGAYREYVSTRTGPDVAYPRFRAFSAGVFVRLN